MLIRFAGKQWLPPKKAFRPASGLTSYEQRNKTRVAQAAMKAKEKEMKEEKETERKVRIWLGHRQATGYRS
jgi:rRNA-processing protein CGR1